MGKFRALQVKFNKDYLNKLTKDPNSGVFKQNCKYHIALHPAQLTDFGASVGDELGRKVSKYDDIFQGIMLGYENIKLQSQTGLIGVDNCYVHVNVQADFFIFRPEVGMILTGLITRTTKDHVGCLVYNTFNISLPKCEDDDESWLGHNAIIQTGIVFRISFVDLNAQLPYIKGEIITLLSDDKIPDPSRLKNKKKLNKKIKLENMYEDEDNISPKPKKKHKKKHSKNDEVAVPIPIIGYEFGDEKVSKKTKRNKLEQNAELDTKSVSKHKKRHRKKEGHKESRESMDNSEREENDIFFEEAAIIKIKLEDNEEEPHDIVHKKNGNNSNEMWENKGELEVFTKSKRGKKNKEQIVDDEESNKKENHKKNKDIIKHNGADLSLESLTLHSPTTLNSKEKREKRHSGNNQLLEKEININDLIKQEINEMTKHSKKTKKHEHDDEEILKKKETRKEKKRRQEQNENVSLEPLGLKYLFDDSLVNLNSSYSQTMANDGDKGKKRRKSNSISQEIFLENIKLEEDSEPEKIITLHSPTTPNSKEKREKRRHSGNNQLLEKEIKIDDLISQEISEMTKHSKKTKKQEHDDEEILKKKETRKEKKRRQEQDENVSLEPLGLKYLFDDSLVNLNSSYSQTMANDGDKGKKRRKSNSISQEIFLENIKLEEDSEPEKIITLHSPTPNSKEKREKRHSGNNQLLEKEIKIDDLISQEISEMTKHSKKTKKHEHDNEEILKKKETRKEKKRRQEQDENVSLEPLGLKYLFDDSLVNLNSSYSQTMANDGDKGKKRRKSNSISQEIFLENIKLEEDSEAEKIITLHSPTTPNSKEKREKRHSGNNQLLEKEIKIDDLISQEINEMTKHSKKKNSKKHEHEDEEILKEKETRKEKKRRQEQDENVSLESLGLKYLFDDSLVNLNSSYSQTMANDGKKRRKSNSISHEILLENIKLEEDSEPEKIISGNKRKRSKSVSN